MQHKSPLMQVLPVPVQPAAAAVQGPDATVPVGHVPEWVNIVE